MKKVILIHCLWFLSVSIVYSQSGIDSACHSKIETIFKAHNLKIKFEAVQSLYRILGIEDSTITNKQTLLHISKSGFNTYFEAIKGRPLDGYETPSINSEKYFKQLIDTVSRFELVPVERKTDEEMNRFVKQIDCTPQEAFKEYADIIRNIKADKEAYLTCIDKELAKDDLSEFAKQGMLYTFVEPGAIIGPQYFTKLYFLNFFKETIFGENLQLLPE